MTTTLILIWIYTLVAAWFFGRLLEDGRPATLKVRLLALGTSCLWGFILFWAGVLWAWEYANKTFQIEFFLTYPFGGWKQYMDEGKIRRMNARAQNRSKEINWFLRTTIRLINKKWAAHNQKKEA